MSQQNKNEEINNEEIKSEEVRTDFEDFDKNFKHEDLSNDDFAEVIIEGRGEARPSEGEYLENVVLASGVASLQSERFRSKTKSTLAAEKALKELEEQSLKSLRIEADAMRNFVSEEKEPDLKPEITFSQDPEQSNNIHAYEKVEKLAQSDVQPFQIDEKDENSDKKRHHYSSHSHSKIARKWRKMKKWQKGIIIFLLALLLIIIAAVLTVYFMHNSGKKAMMNGITGDNFENSIIYDDVEYIYNQDITSIAFLGVDKETFGLQDDLVGTAGQNDVNMVVAVNTKTGETHVIVIPRDTLVDVRKYSLDGDYMGTDEQQLCLAYAYGDGANTSCDNAIFSIQKILYGIPINTYVALNMEGISALNDSLGGVTLTSPTDFGEDILKGQQITLHGDDSEMYIRLREHTLEGDAERRERQIAYVKAYVSQAAKQSLKNPETLRDIYNVGKDYTVTNLTLSRSLYFGTSILSNVSEVLSFDNIESLKGKLQLDESGYALTVLDEDAVLKQVLDIYYTPLK